MSALPWESVDSKLSPGNADILNCKSRVRDYLLSMLKRRRNNASDCNFFKYWLCLKEAGFLPNFLLYFVFTHLKILFKVTFVSLSFLLLLIRKWSDPWLKNRDTIRTVSFVIHCTPTVVGGGGEGLAEEATRISDSSSEDDSYRLAKKDLHNSKFSH